MYKVKLGAGKQLTISLRGKTYLIKDGTIIEDDKNAGIIRTFVEGAGGEFLLVDEKPKRKKSVKKAVNNGKQEVL